MFYAKDQHGNYISAEKASKQSSYFCPSCLETVVLKQGQLKIAHFAHRKHGCYAFSEGETAEHLAGKKLLASWCYQFHWQVELEAYQEDFRQRPDVLCRFKDGHRLAFEFQCAPLTATAMFQRSAGYQQHNFKYVWILGRRHYPQRNLTQQIAQFIRWHHNLGFYLIYLDTVYERFEVLYGIQVADLLPLKYMRFFASNLKELENFLHTDHHIRYFRLTNSEQEKQIRHLVFKMHQRSRQIYSLQNMCYERRLSFIDLVKGVLTAEYFPPIYRQPAFLWKARFCLLFPRNAKNTSMKKFLNQHNIFIMPFVSLNQFCYSEWTEFQKMTGKIDFSQNYRYN